MMTKEESIATHNKQGLPPYKDLERNCVSNALPFADEIMKIIYLLPIFFK